MRARRPDERWTDDERFKLTALSTLVHESQVNALELVLRDAPPWAPLWLLELVEDGLIALFRVPDDRDAAACASEPSARLSADELRTVLARPETWHEVGVLTLPAADILEREPPRLFGYASGDRDAFRSR